VLLAVLALAVAVYALFPLVDSSASFVAIRASGASPSPAGA
jgi:hypothetical protein